MPTSKLGGMKQRGGLLRLRCMDAMADTDRRRMGIRGAMKTGDDGDRL